MTQDARAVNWDSITTVAKVGADPAIEIAPDGIAYMIIVPDKERWRVEGGKMGLVASGDAGNRSMQMIFSDGIDVVFGSSQGLTITSGQTKVQTWMRNSYLTTAGTQFGLHIPDVECMAGWRIYVYIANFDAIAAGDNATALTLWIKRLPA